MLSDKRRQDIRILGQLAARLDGDPRHPVEIIVEFFIMTELEKRDLLRAYEAAGKRAE
jgi:hypothetical protein